MFNKTEVVTKTLNASPFSPANLRVVTDKKGMSFVFQTECIISVEPYWDVKSDPNYCCVNTVDGNKIWIKLSPADFFAALQLTNLS